MGATTYLFASSMPTEAQELAQGLRRRDPDLFDRLIEQYHYRLFRYLLYLTGSRETAEDLFQETWIRVLERGHQYNVKWKFEAWLFTIARHLTIDWMRKKPAGATLDLDEAGDEARPAAGWASAGSGAGSPFDLAAGREESERVRTALGQLPAAFREVLLLRFQEDLALEEIAAVTAAPLSTVKSRLYRGLDALRATMEESKP
ncbi:MAG TPA: RNA polymerase sigma factor [Terriglobia bacterium]|nr:RNA polymerase sigma factor [Terriglobia bacterium]